MPRPSRRASATSSPSPAPYTTIRRWGYSSCPMPRSEPPRQPPVGGNLADSFRVVANRLAQLEEGTPRRHPHPAPDERVARSDLDVEPGAPLPSGPTPHGARAVPVIEPARRVRLVGGL